VITPDHSTDRFDRRSLADAIAGTAEALARSSGYASINWNYLPSAGASIVHPHLQGMADSRPTGLPISTSPAAAATSPRTADSTGTTWWSASAAQTGSSLRMRSSGRQARSLSASGRCGVSCRYRHSPISGPTSSRWSTGSSGSSPSTGTSEPVPLTLRSFLMLPGLGAGPPRLLLPDLKTEPEQPLDVRFGVHGAAAPGAGYPDAPRRPGTPLPGGPRAP